MDFCFEPVVLFRSILNHDGNSLVGALQNTSNDWHLVYKIMRESIVVNNPAVVLKYNSITEYRCHFMVYVYIYILSTSHIPEYKRE